MSILSVYTGRENKYKHRPWKYQPVEFLPRGNVAVEIKKYPVEINMKRTRIKLKQKLHYFYPICVSIENQSFITSGN